MSDVGVSRVKERPSSNFDARPLGTVIDILMFHYTDMASCDLALERLRDPKAKVSAHYLIGRDGGVFRLVSESDRAWHAGESFWRGHTDINGRSIGIELDNPGHSGIPTPFPPAQMAALATLCLGILARHPIPARNVIGHSDVAPRRKQDPGYLFNWPELAQKGIGVWPAASRAETPDDAIALKRLQEIGYETVDPRASLIAFQRRYRPAQIDGLLDPETMGLLGAVLACCEGA